MNVSVVCPSLGTSLRVYVCDVATGKIKSLSLVHDWLYSPAIFLEGLGESIVVT